MRHPSNQGQQHSMTPSEGENTRSPPDVPKRGHSKLVRRVAFLLGLIAFGLMDVVAIVVARWAPPSHLGQARHPDLAAVVVSAVLFLAWALATYAHERHWDFLWRCVEVEGALVHARVAEEIVTGRCSYVLVRYDFRHGCFERALKLYAHVSWAIGDTQPGDPIALLVDPERPSRVKLAALHPPIR